MNRIRTASLVFLAVCGTWGTSQAATQPSTPQERGASDVYRTIIRAAGIRSPATRSNSVYAAAKEAFYAGKIDEAIASAAEFTKSYTRNLNMTNDALELVLLTRGFRDFRTSRCAPRPGHLAVREAGTARFRVGAGRANPRALAGRKNPISPSLPDRRARPRSRRSRGGGHPRDGGGRFIVEEPARARRAEAGGDETLALGQGRDRALKLYQELLERFPDSPLAPGVRSQVLEMRKGMQL